MFFTLTVTYQQTMQLKINFRFPLAVLKPCGGPETEKPEHLGGVINTVAGSLQGSGLLPLTSGLSFIHSLSVESYYMACVVLATGVKEMSSRDGGLLKRMGQGRQETGG